MLFMAFHACKKSPDYLIGKWQILTVVENNESNDLIENWMHLKSNGTFESYDGNSNKSENGTWTYQLKVKRLLIDGEGETGDSQWNLTMKNDTLIFHSTSDNLRLIAIKIE